MSLQKQESMQKENKMGVMPVKRLIITMSLPMMVSMLVQALYNIVDSIFVSQINEQALTAVTLAFPMQTLMIAVGSGTGVGINALLSEVSWGEEDRQGGRGCQYRTSSDLLLLPGLPADRDLRHGAVLQHPDVRPADRGIWDLLSSDRLLSGLRDALSDDLRASASVDGHDRLLHDLPDDRRDLQHHLRSDPDLRILRIPEAWRCRRGLCDGFRTDARSFHRTDPEPEEE